MSTPKKRRLLPRRERRTARELEDFFYFLQDLHEYYRDEFEEGKKKEEEIEKKAKEKATKKPFEGLGKQLVSNFVFSIPLTILWIWLLHPLLK